MDPAGFEPTATSLQGRHSTAELRAHAMSGPGQTRTADTPVNSRALYLLSYGPVIPAAGFEPATCGSTARRSTAELCREAICYGYVIRNISGSRRRELNPQPAAYGAAALPVELRRRVKPAEGLEPSTIPLQGGRSTKLSYAGEKEVTTPQKPREKV